MKSCLTLCSIGGVLCSALLLLSVSISVGGEPYIPPPPDKTKTLPANDGDTEGCNSSRFDCVLGGEAVLDKQTGLIWARDTELLAKGVPWDEAMAYCHQVTIGGKQGWRLPTREELISIIDTSQSRPALPEGHPFPKMRAFSYGGMGDLNYWTSSEYQDDTNNVWMIYLTVGRVYDSIKLFDGQVWPVRNSE